MDRGASLWHWKQCYKEHKKALAMLRMMNKMRPNKFDQEIIEKLVIMGRMREVIEKWERSSIG